MGRHKSPYKNRSLIEIMECRSSGSYLLNRFCIDQLQQVVFMCRIPTFESSLFYCCSLLLLIAYTKTLCRERNKFCTPILKIPLFLPWNLIPTSGKCSKYLVSDMPIKGNVS